MDDEDNPPPRLISIPGNELSPRTTSRASRQIPPYLPSKSSNRPRVPSFDGKERCSEQEFELVDRMEHRRLSSPTMQDLEVLSYSFTADNDDEVVEPSFTRRNDRLNLDNDAGVRLSIISASEYGDQSRQEEKSHYYPPDHKPLHSRPTELDFTKIKNIRKSIISLPPTLNSPPGPEDKKKPSITPTLALLFSLTSRPSTIAIVLPAVGLSVVAGLIPPYMTELIGVAFQAFTTYALILATEPTDDILSAAKVELLKSTKNSAFQFCGLAGLILVASTVGIGLWVINGERVVRALRKEVFTGVGAREMAWFDLGMGANGEKEEAGEEESEGGQGVGGLMGRFARGTDEVRTATSQTLGLILQYFISFLACLGLSFYRNALLTIVVLSSIPMIIGIVAVTEKMATLFSEKERDFAAKAAGRADRVLAAIPTIKAFNAEIKESEAFDGLNHKASEFYSKLHLIWGIRAGVTQFILLAMFVQGFWFGSYLVQTGKSSPAAVNTCFWACLLASTYLQLCLPMLVTLEKGKLAMADLLGLARVAPEVERPKSIISLSGSAVFLETKKLKKIRRGSSEPFAGQGIVNTLALPPTIHENLPPLSPSPSNFGFPQSPSSPLFVPLAAMGGRAIKRRGGAPRSLQKIRPTKFSGELSLKNVTFHYPSRPHPSLPALDNVSLYLAAKETTFIVGGSGSGKSTVGNLLLGLYKPEMGTIEVEEQGLEWIDEQWLRGHVACVSQGASVIFDGTVHDNVTIGVVGQIRKDGTRRDPKDVSREEVEKACRSALVHEFVRDLPEGYDTFLSVGATLSGGQRQRLALARAWLRDPTVLILDEATSALDATSRLLVSEAVKIWRQNKTTIVITHDLTPIGPADFVYVMTNGVVAEAGFRRDLELNIGGPFCELAGTQADPTKPKDNLDETESLADEPEWTLADDSYYQMNSRRPSAATIDEIEYIEPPYRNSTFAGSGMFPPTNLVRQAQEYGEIRRVSAAFLNNRKSGHGDRRRTQMEPPRYDFASLSQSNRASNFSFIGLENAAQNAASKRPGGKRIRHKTMIEGDGLGKEWSEINRKKAADGIDHIAIEVENSTEINMALMELARKLYPTIPNKYLFWLGLFSSIAVGACTPVFSSLLARLMANLGNPNAGNLVITTSLLILLMAFIDGVFTFLKFYVLERCGMGWIVSLRSKSLTLVLKQDKSFFDKSENSTSSLVNILIKDSEDARTLVGTIVGQMFVVVSMIFIGIVWAFAVGWELTLVGLGLAPVFVVATRLQATVIARFEGKNKRMREDITKKFHQVISNIRAIRAMSIEPVFVDRFEESIEKAYVGGAKAAPFAGFGFGLGASLTYIAEALMFYVGALLIASGKYTFVKMIEVFTLIIFSVTFSSQIMTYLPQMTKSIRAAIDLTRLLDLESETEESQGRMTFPISGNISFNNVIFAYPTRPSVPILKGMSFEIKPGECVGIVGASGSGKSTVASLLQRLYEPTLGSITLDGRQLSRTDVRYLRDHIAIVSQHPALFDMTIAENIAYGCNALSQDEIVTAAILAQVHDFIISLPKGYATMLGENASLISGGQAQRLQIARALVRHRELLILDECTSALDAQNQAGIMETIMKAKIGKTTVIVTHKLAVMEMCDRLLVVVDGKVVESGTPEELKLRSGGIFKSMASAGEWSG